MLTVNRNSQEPTLRNLVALTCLLISGCVSITTSDSVLYVLGKVTDERSIAVTGATVNLGELETITDENGCFLFDGVYPAHPINIEISKIGYKTIREERPYNGYYIGALLTKLSSQDHGELTWRELDISDPNFHVNC